MLAEGSVAPEFQLGAWSLAKALKDGPVLLAFFKISCPTCQFTFPFLQRLLGKLPILAISQDDKTGTDQFLSRFDISFPAVLDAAPAYTVSNLYGIRNVPTLYLVETDGRISRAAAGFNKGFLEALGERFGFTVFRSGEQVPALRPG